VRPCYKFDLMLKAKIHIAALLTFIFLAKFLAIDANGLSALFIESNITFIKPVCKKKNSPKRISQSLEYSQANLSASEIITLSGFCTSQFTLKLFTWEQSNPKPTAVFIEHASSNLMYCYLEKDLPPPRRA